MQNANPDSHSTPSKWFEPISLINLDEDPSCECMVCDLPDEASHGPVEWNLGLSFPGPYPTEGEVDMLLCEHCRNDWVDREWEPPFHNFIVI